MSPTRMIPFVEPPSALAAVLAEVMDNILSATGAERAAVILAHADTGALEFLALRGMTPEYLTEYEFEMCHEIIEYVFRTQEPAQTHNANMDDYYYRPKPWIDLKLYSVLAAPLIVRGKTIGVLYCDQSVASSGLFQPEDFDPFVAIANRVAVTIEQAHQIDSGSKLMMQGNQRALGSDEDDGI